MGEDPWQLPLAGGDVVAAAMPPQRHPPAAGYLQARPSAGEVLRGA